MLSPAAAAARDFLIGVTPARASRHSERMWRGPSEGWVPIVGRGLVLGAIAASVACSDSGGRRETFEITSYRFENNEVVVESQQPGDPACYVEPVLDTQLDEEGLHLSVTYVRTSQEFCIVPCPLKPLTSRQALPDGSSGQPVILDPATNRACTGVDGGPAKVP